MSPKTLRHVSVRLCLVWWKSDRKKMGGGILERKIGNYLFCMNGKLEGKKKKGSPWYPSFFNPPNFGKKIEIHETHFYLR